MPFEASLKPVGDPRGDETQGRRTVHRRLLERAVEHEDVVDVCREVTRELPVELRGRPAAFIPPGHAVARHDELPGNSVEPVMNALAPVKAPSAGNDRRRRRTERDDWFETNRVVGTEQLRAARVR